MQNLIFFQKFYIRMNHHLFQIVSLLQLFYIFHDFYQFIFLYYKINQFFHNNLNINMDQEGLQTVAIRSTNINKFITNNVQVNYDVQMFRLLRQRLNNVNLILKGNQVFQYVFPIFIENVCLNIVAYLTIVVSLGPLNIINSLIQDFNRYLETHNLLDLKKIYVTLQKTRNQSFYTPFKAQFDFILELQILITDDDSRQLNISLSKDEKMLNINQNITDKKIIQLKSLIQQVKKCNVAIVTTQMILYVSPEDKNINDDAKLGLELYLQRFMVTNKERMDRLQMLNQYFKVKQNFKQQQQIKMSTGRDLCRVLDLNICQQYLNAVYLANNNHVLLHKVKAAYSYVNLKIALRMFIDERYWQQYKPKSEKQTDGSSYYFNQSTTYNHIIFNNIPFQSYEKFQSNVEIGLRQLRVNNDSTRQILKSSLQKTNYDLNALPDKILESFHKSISLISEQFRKMKGQNFDVLHKQIRTLNDVWTDMGNIDAIKNGIAKSLQRFQVLFQNNEKKTQFLNSSMKDLQDQLFQSTTRLEGVMALAKGLLQNININNAEEYMRINQNILSLSPTVIMQTNFRCEKIKSEFDLKRFYQNSMDSNLLIAAQNVKKGFQDINSNLKGIAKKVNSIDDKVSQILNIIKKSQEVQLYSSHNNKQINKSILEVQVNKEINKSQQSISKYIRSLLYQNKSSSDIIIQIQKGIQSLRQNIIQKDDFIKIVSSQTQTLKQFFTSFEIAKNNIDNQLQDGVILTHNKFNDLNALMGAIETNFDNRLNQNSEDLYVYFNKLYAAQVSLKLDIQNGFQDFRVPLIKLQQYIQRMQKKYTSESNSIKTIKIKMQEIYESLITLSSSNAAVFNSYNNSMQRIQQLNLSYIKDSNANLSHIISQLGVIQNRNRYLTQITKQGFNSIANFLFNIEGNMKQLINSNHSQQYKQQKIIYDTMQQHSKKFLISINNSVDMNLKANRQTNNIVIQSHYGIMDFLQREKQNSLVYQKQLFQQNFNLNQKLKFMFNQASKQGQLDQRKFEKVNRLIKLINTRLSLLNKNNKMSLLIPELKEDFSNVDDIISNFSLQLSQIDLTSNKSSDIIESLKQLKGILGLHNSATLMDISTKIANINMTLKHSEEKILEKEKLNKLNQEKIQQLNKTKVKFQKQLSQFNLQYQLLKSKQKQSSQRILILQQQFIKKTRIITDTQDKLTNIKNQRFKYQSLSKIQLQKINAFQENVMKLKSEKERLQSTNKDFQKVKLQHRQDLKKIQQLQIAIQRETKQSRKTKNQLYDSSEALAKQNKKYQILKLKYQAYQQDINKGKLQLKSLNSQITMLRQQLEQVQKERYREVTLNKSKVQQIKQLISRIKDYQLNIQGLNEEISKAKVHSKQSLEILNSKVNRYESQLDKLKRQYQTILLQNQSLRQFESKLKRVKAQLSQKEKKQQQIKKQLIKSGQQIQNLQKQIIIQNETIKTLQASNKNLEKRINELNDKINSLTKSSQNTIQEYKILKKKMIQVLNQFKNKYTKILNKDSSQLMIQDFQIQALLNLVIQDNDQIFRANLNSISSKMIQFVDSLGNEIIMLSDQILVLRQKNQQLLVEEKKKQSQIIQKTIEISKLQNDIIDYRKQILKYENKNLDLENKLSDLNKLKDQLQLKRKQQSKLLENNNQLKILEREYSELKKAFKKVTQQKREDLDLAQELRQYQEKIYILKAQNNRLKSGIKFNLKHKQYLVKIAKKLQIQVSQYQSQLQSQRRRIQNGDYINIQDEDIMANVILGLINQRYLQLITAYESVNKPNRTLSTDHSLKSQMVDISFSEFLNDSNSSTLSEGLEQLNKKFQQNFNFQKKKKQQISKFKGFGNFIGKDYSNIIQKQSLDLNHHRVFQVLFKSLNQSVQVLKETIQQFRGMETKKLNSKVYSVIQSCITLFEIFENQFKGLIQYMDQHLI